MNPAKLRRSRDVSERDPVKIEITFQIRDLACCKQGLSRLERRGE